MNTNLNREGFFYIPYFEIVAWKYRKEHSKTFASVYGAIFRICEMSDNGICFASVRHTISKRVGVSAKQFGNTLDRIVTDGLVKELPNDGHSTKAYMIDVEKLDELQAEFDRSQIGIIEEAVVETTSPLSSNDYGVKSKLLQPVVETPAKQNIVLAENVTENIEEVQKSATSVSVPETTVSTDESITLSKDGYMLSPLRGCRYNYRSLEEREFTLKEVMKNSKCSLEAAISMVDAPMPV